MSVDSEGAAPQKRGEAAWKADRAAIDERNDRARKAGREERREKERRVIEARLAADLREDAEIQARFGSR